MKRLNQGFTLIELMIVVAIVAILAAIAYPSYTRYVEKARRADAKVALLDAAQRLERCYTQNNNYANCLTFPIGSPDGFYTVTASPTITVDSIDFTLTAAPVATRPQAGDTRCGTYTLESDGDRDASGSLGTDLCW